MLAEKRLKMCMGENNDWRKVPGEMGGHLEHRGSSAVAGRHFFPGTERW